MVQTFEVSNVFFPFAFSNLVDNQSRFTGTLTLDGRSVRITGQVAGVVEVYVGGLSADERRCDKIEVVLRAHVREASDFELTGNRRSHLQFLEDVMGQELARSTSIAEEVERATKARKAAEKAAEEARISRQAAQEARYELIGDMISNLALPDGYYAVNQRARSIGIHHLIGDEEIAVAEEFGVEGFGLLPRWEVYEVEDCGTYLQIKGQAGGEWVMGWWKKPSKTKVPTSHPGIPDKIPMPEGESVWGPDWAIVHVEGRAREEIPLFQKMEKEKPAAAPSPKQESAPAPTSAPKPANLKKGGKKEMLDSLADLWKLKG